MTQRDALWEDIARFSKNKYKIAAVFIILGLSGLILPVIPGLLLLAIGIFIIKPEWFSKIRDKLRKKNQ
jgi:hypothetical protein